MKLIVLKTAVDKEIIIAVFSEYVRLKSKLADPQSELSSETLNKFHILIDNFYRAEKNRKKNPTLNLTIQTP